MSSTFALVDDADARLKYSTGNWIPSGNSNEYNSTTHGTYSAGATMTFVFNGTMVKVYGTIISKDAPNSSDPITTYTVDGGGRTTFAPVTLPTVQYRQLHFHSEELPSGEHTLVMESIAPDAGVWLDYLLYLPLAGDKPDGVMVNESQSLSASSGSTATSTLLKSDTAVTTPTSSLITSNASGTPGAPGAAVMPSSKEAIVVGATVGGAVLLLVACLVGVLCYRKRRRGRHAQRPPPPGHIQTSSSSTMTPFLAQSPTLSVVTKWSPIAASLSSSSPSRGVEERPPAYQQ